MSRTRTGQHHHHHEPPSYTGGFLALACLLMIAPLFRAGKPPLATMTLELVALCGLVLVFWNGHLLKHLRRSELWLISALFTVPLIQLIPIPTSLRAALPGQTPYFELLATVGFGDAADVWTTLSLDATQTMQATLTLLIPVSTFLLTRSLHASDLRKLLSVLLVVISTQAIVGMIQFATVDGDQWYFGMEYTHRGSAVGTYTSKNNFAALMYTGLMISIALTFASIGKRPQPDWILYASASAMLLVAVLLSRSRAGTGLALVGIVVAATMFGGRIGGGRAAGLIGSVVAAATGFALAIGLGPVVRKFVLMDPVEDGRWLLFEDVRKGIETFLPLGSGVGTFQQTFPRFQDLSIAETFVNRAHSSYLEWLFTGGLGAGIVMILMLAAFARQWFHLGKHWGEFRFIKAAAGLGMLLVLGHETVDYNLFVPANMIYFGFLAGLFFHHHRDEPSGQRAAVHQKSRVRKRAGIPQPLIPAAPDAQDDNPFLHPRPSDEAARQREEVTS